MERMTATAAKQNFAGLLEAAAEGPVAIDRHGRVAAVVLAPKAFQALEHRAAPVDARASRSQARLAQSLVEKERLLWHHRIALDLVTDPERARALLNEARASVRRWRDQGLCSVDYIERWEALLSLPRAQLARRIVGDLDGWGDALRQNSPWAGAA